MSLMLLFFSHEMRSVMITLSPSHFLSLLCLTNAFIRSLCSLEHVHFITLTSRSHTNLFLLLLLLLYFSYLLKFLLLSYCSSPSIPYFITSLYTHLSFTHSLIHCCFSHFSGSPLLPTYRRNWSQLSHKRILWQLWSKSAAIVHRVCVYVSVFEIALPNVKKEAHARSLTLSPCPAAYRFKLLDHLSPAPGSAAPVWVAMDYMCMLVCLFVWLVFL